MSFLDVSYTDDQVSSLIEHLSIDKMKQNESVDDTKIMVKLGIFKEGEGSFVRKGETGGWRNRLDKEMLKTMADWKEKCCRNWEVPLDKLWPD